MAVSHDGYYAKSVADDMRWLEPSDKKCFRLLSGVGGILGVSQKTRELMPNVLEGRKMVTLTRKELPPDAEYDADLHYMTLGLFCSVYQGGWLIGGGELANVAYSHGFIKEVHLCRSSIRLGYGLPLRFIRDLGDPVMTTKIGLTTVELYARGR
jgi:dihydrofolate reductase